MQKRVKQKVVIIGCGNLAWHVAKHFSTLKKFELHIYNHTANKALNEFKTKLGCTVNNSLVGITNNADYYFICVSDKNISTVSETIKVVKTRSLIIHTSGSKSIDELSLKISNRAVFYPVQTFSKSDAVNWAEVHIAIEANNVSSLAGIKKLAQLFSKHVVSINSEERSKLHLTAVLVNNFTNALYVAADNFISTHIKNKEVNLKILMPIIKQTGEKIKKLSPASAQTGPAKRKDKEVIKQHLKLLSENKALKKVYKQLSNLIDKQQNGKHVKL